MQRFAYEDAIDWFQLAITDLASLAGSAEHRVDLLTSLSRAANRAGEISLWRESSEQAIALARRLGDPQRQARAALDMLGTRGPWSDASMTSALSDAMDALHGAAPSPARLALIAELQARLSGFMMLGDPDRSARLAEQALAVAEQAGEPRVLALALVQTTSGYRLDESQLADRLRRAEALAASVDDVVVELSVASAQMVAAVTWARRDDFDAALARYAELATQTRSVVHLVLSAVDHAGAAGLDGRYTESIDMAEAAVLQLEHLGDRNLLASVLNAMTVAHRELGTYAAHREDVDRRLQNTFWPSPGPLVARARLAAELGDAEAAARAIEAAIAEPEALLGSFVRRYRLAMLAEAAELVGYGAAASRLASWLTDELRYGECVVVGANACYGAVRRYLGLLAMAVGHHDDAVEHHARALDVHVRLRAPGWAARSRFDLARALVARNAADDTSRAHRLLGEAGATAAKLGMTALIGEIGALTPTGR